MRTINYAKIQYIYKLEYSINNAIKRFINNNLLNVVLKHIFKQNNKIILYLFKQGGNPIFVVQVTIL